MFHHGRKHKNRREGKMAYCPELLDNAMFGHIYFKEERGMKITPKLTEQTRRWLTRTIWEFYHSPMGSKSGEAFEQWHEDKAKELLEFLNMSETNRVLATEKLSVGSISEKRLKLCA